MVKSKEEQRRWRASLKGVEDEFGPLGGVRSRVKRRGAVGRLEEREKAGGDPA